MSDHIEFEKFSQRRNDFYRNQFRRMVSFLIILLFISGGLVVIYNLIAVAQSPARYYASTTAGDVIPIESLSSPVVTSAFIQQWSQTVARSVYNLNFLSYDSQLKQAQQYFTEDGWVAFQNALKQSGLIDQITGNKLYLSTVVNGTVVITAQYVKAGYYTWEVQLPLLISFSSSSMKQKKQIYVSMTIKRVPELEVARGIAVTKFTQGGDDFNV